MDIQTTRYIKALTNHYGILIGVNHRTKCIDVRKELNFRSPAETVKLTDEEKNEIKFHLRSWIPYYDIKFID